MMKRKILAVTIPVVGCITVVGAGFSAWYFDAAVTNSSESSALNTFVTEKVESKDVALSFTNSNKDAVLDDKYLILDQGGVNNTDPTVGIMIADSKLNETVADPVEKPRKYNFTVKFGKDSSEGTSSKLTLNSIYDAHMELSVTVEIDLSDRLYQYVTLVGGASMKVSYTQNTGENSETITFDDTDGDHKWTATYTLKAGKLDDLSTEPISQFEWDFEIDLSTSAELKNSLFRYAEDNTNPGDNVKPKNGDDYDAMVTALGLGEGGTAETAAKLGFVATAKIGEPTSN